MKPQYAYRNGEFLKDGHTMFGLDVILEMRALQAKVKSLEDSAEKLGVAVGLLTTLKPSMEIDATDPVGMAQEIMQHIQDNKIELRDKMDVEDIVKDCLTSHGFDGLCRDDCGCKVDDLMLGRDCGDSCQPAFLRLCVDCADNKSCGMFSDGVDYCLHPRPMECNGDAELCEHGKGLTDYCAPCGRVNGG